MKRFHITLLLTLLASMIGASAQDDATKVVVTETIEIIPAAADSVAPKAAKSTLPPAYYDTEKHTTHFSWGVEAGSSIDMSGQEFSSVDISACVGYKGHALRFLGLGGTIKMMINNGSRCYPVYAMMRTSFTSRPVPAFLEIKAGCSFCNMLDNVYQRQLYGSIAVGYTLAKGRTFSSHVTLGYELITLDDCYIGEQLKTFGYLHAAAVKLGICF